MSGYTPLFGSLTTGTLCGKWPDIGLWPIILSLSDRHGVVDVTPAYIAGVTGLPLADVVACMKRFCDVDLGSRSDIESGARLVLVDEHRDWGWKIVNHGFYREKARKAAFDAARITDGRNADRMKTRRDPAGPAKTRAHPPSDSDSDSNSNTDLNKEEEKPKSKTRASARSRTESTEFPEGFALDEPLRQQALSRAADCDVDQAFEQFKAHHVTRGSTFKNWRSAWVTWIGNFEQFGYPRRRNGAAVPKGMENVKW